MAAFKDDAPEDCESNLVSAEKLVFWVGLNKLADHEGKQISVNGCGWFRGEIISIMFDESQVQYF